MKILLYCDQFYPETSGISDSTISVARGLKALGHTVGFVATKYSAEDYAAVGAVDDTPLTNEGFEIFRVPSLPMRGSASPQGRAVMPLGWSLGFVRRFKPDVLHAQDPFGVGVEAFYASRLFRIPLIGTNHTFIGEFVKLHGPVHAKWFQNVMDRFYSFSYNRCAFVSVVTGRLSTDMKKHGFKRGATVISNPLDLGRFSPALDAEKMALRKKLGLSGPTLIYAGRLSIEKEIDKIIRAFEHVVKKIPGAHLVIAGNGDHEVALKGLAADLGLSDKVIFPGFLDHATLSQWYKASDAFVATCPIETQCLSLMQALATALPAVGVSAGALMDHIRPEWGTLVPQNDVEKLAAALEDLLKNPERAEMGRRGREYVSRFSQDVIAQQWVGIYDAVVRKRRKLPTAPDPKTALKISIVIPAHNEEHVIAPTLNAALLQQYPSFEVIVVDNASSDKTSEVASKFPVRVVREDRKGLLWARERGRLEATGDIVVQMDADCLPDSLWLARGAAHFVDPEVAGVTGPYDYYDGGKVFRNFSLLSQKYVYRAMSKAIQALGSGAVLIGGNSFIRASVLEKMGGYNTAIKFYGEDTDTAKRVSEHGRVVFDPRLTQKTSARRFKAEGSLKIGTLYVFHFFKVIYRSIPRSTGSE